MLAEQNHSRALWNARIGDVPSSGISLVTYNLGRVKGYLCKYDEAEQLLLEALRLEEQAATEATRESEHLRADHPGRQAEFTPRSYHCPPE